MNILILSKNRFIKVIPKKNV